MSYVLWSFFCVQWVQLRWEVIVCFVDIGGIDDHQCLNFPFITNFGRLIENQNPPTVINQDLWIFNEYSGRAAHMIEAFKKKSFWFLLAHISQRLSWVFFIKKWQASIRMSYNFSFFFRSQHAQLPNLPQIFH
jgi:hypothetical protein